MLPPPQRSSSCRAQAAASCAIRLRERSNVFSCVARRHASPAHGGEHARGEEELEAVNSPTRALPTPASARASTIGDSI